MNHLMFFYPWMIVELEPYGAAIYHWSELSASSDAIVWWRGVLDRGDSLEVPLTLAANLSVMNFIAEFYICSISSLLLSTFNSKETTSSGSHPVDQAWTWIPVALLDSCGPFTLIMLQIQVTLDLPSSSLMLFALPVIPEWGIFMFGASILSPALCIVGNIPQWSPDCQYSGSWCWDYFVAVLWLGWDQHVKGVSAVPFWNRCRQLSHMLKLQFPL